MLKLIIFGLFFSKILLIINLKLVNATDNSDLLTPSPTVAKKVGGNNLEFDKNVVDNDEVDKGHDFEEKMQKMLRMLFKVPTNADTTSPNIDIVTMTNLSSLVKNDVFEEEKSDFSEEPIDDLPLTRKSRKSGQRSLVIVFDATGSMIDDLEQLRKGAEIIIDEFSKRDDSPIYNYIFVPFRDPKYGPRLVTTEKAKLMESLQNLSLYGGGDCPEASMGGLIHALEVALPHSFVYVFTDATAKDYKLDEKVLSLVQSKQTPVTFLLTGFCNQRNSPGYNVYTKIAAASNGQVYDLNKNDIEEVLVSVKNSLDINRVPLAAVDSDKGKSHSISLDVDSTLKEFSVSVAGSHPEIKVFDSKFLPYNDLVDILDLNNIKIVNIIDPSPGTWNIQASSDSAHSIRMSGITDTIFKFGFSLENPEKITETAYGPVMGHKNIFSVHPSNSKPVKDIESVKILLFDEKNNDEKSFSFKMPLKLILAEEMIYATEEFMPPRQRFKIVINGRDQEDNKLERLLSTAITSTKMPPPDVFIEDPYMKVFETAKLHLKCHTVSLVPVTTQWLRNNKVLNETRSNRSNTLDLIIENVTKL